MRSSQSIRWALVGFSSLVLLFLLVPILIVVPMSFSSSSSLEFPPAGLSLRWFESFFGDPRWLEAAWTSFLVAICSSTLAIVLGTLASYGLVRFNLPKRSWIEGNFVAPLILPPIILAVALYIMLAKVGLLGTIFGLVLGHTILCAPYVVLLMTVAIQSVDVRLEQVAYTLGASWFRTMIRIVIPNLLPSLAATWLLVFVVSFDEVILSLFVSGPHMTIPKKMFNELILEVNPTITAIATLLIVFSAISICIIGYFLNKAKLLDRVSR